MFTQMKNGRWTLPQKTSFSTENDWDFNPYLSPNEKQLVLASMRPVKENESQNTHPDLFLVKRDKENWNQPESFGKNVNSDETDGCPTIAKNGNLYFFSNREGDNDIYVSRFVDGEYAISENLGFPINSDLDECDPFISQDEKYIIVCISGRKEGIGGNDLYISFRNNNRSWAEPINMGNRINSPAKELFPRISHDGKYLFFTSNKSSKYQTYWVDARIIQALKPDFSN